MTTQEEILINFDAQRICIYKGETYCVRDNGAVFRLIKPGGRKRPLDEKWTFGKPSEKRGYMYFSSEVVHRIVATAFHGPQPGANYVVDHIDTNRRNNRPENLRWVTKLENILLNPISLSRVLYQYGSIDNFLSNPGKPLNGELDQNFEWMRTVTKEEAENTRKNLLEWAKSNKLPSGGELGEWVYTQLNQTADIQGDTDDEIEDPLFPSLTNLAFQNYWTTPSEFPYCPKSIESDSLLTYKKSLTLGVVFARNHIYESRVEDVSLINDSSELLVMTKSDGMKPYALAKVYLREDGFVHESIQTYFTLDGALKHFTLRQGLQWDGPDSIDDYC